MRRMISALRAARKPELSFVVVMPRLAATVRVRLSAIA
jgi:hypothetical protein